MIERFTYLDISSKPGPLVLLDVGANVLESALWLKDSAFAAWLAS